MKKPRKTDTSLEEVQCAAWRYGWEYADPGNGLIPDHIDREGHVVSPASIAVVGMVLSSLPVGVKNGWVTRHEAAKRAVNTLRFFACEAEEIGGFFYHFLDMDSGKRAWKCEISSVDSAFVFLGALFCAEFFDADTALERELRGLAKEVVDRADWNWFCDGLDGVSIGYTPERGFNRHIWRGYNEGLLVYILGLGSKTHALPADSYHGWTRDYRTKTIYGIEFLYSRPLFTHLFPHLWLDLRDTRDACMRKHGFDYFENTRRAIAIQEQWARRRGESRKWGVSACDGPRPSGYHGRGVPFGPFDGVYSPPVCLASLPFQPVLALDAWQYWVSHHPELLGEWGVLGAIKPETGWLSGYFGLDQAMLVLMLENGRSGLLWDISREIETLKTGLKRAGFE